MVGHTYPWGLVDEKGICRGHWHCCPYLSNSRPTHAIKAGAVKRARGAKILLPRHSLSPSPSVPSGQYNYSPLPPHLALKKPVMTLINSFGLSKNKLFTHPKVIPTYRSMESLQKAEIHIHILKMFRISEININIKPCEHTHWQVL